MDTLLSAILGVGITAFIILLWQGALTIYEILCEERRIKKPKYKIGDIVVYPDRYFEKGKNDVLEYYQSEIVESYGFKCMETIDKNNEVGWYYQTKHTLEEAEDGLEEDEILFKL